MRTKYVANRKTSVKVLEILFIWHIQSNVFAVIICLKIVLWICEDWMLFGISLLLRKANNKALIEGR